MQILRLVLLQSMKPLPSSGYGMEIEDTQCQTATWPAAQNALRVPSEALCMHS